MLSSVGVPVALALALMAPAVPPAAAAGTTGRVAPGRSVLSRPDPRLFRHAVQRVPTRHRAVALTFNAAWNDAGVRAALTTLRDERVPAAFFLTGQFARRYPEAARALAREHAVGSHSDTHPHFTRLGTREQRREVAAADAALTRAVGRRPAPLFRFPYGEYDARAVLNVNATGRVVLEWTADTRGYLGEQGGQSVGSVVRRAVRHLRPGAVLQMHIGSPHERGVPLDVAALPRLVDAIRARGYRFIDLRDLFTPPSYSVRPRA